MFPLVRSAAASIVRCWAQSSASERYHGSKWAQSINASCSRYAVYSRHFARTYSHVAAPLRPQHAYSGRILRDLDSIPKFSSFWRFQSAQFSTSAEQAASRMKKRNRNTAIYMVSPPIITVARPFLSQLRSFSSAPIRRWNVAYQDVACR